MKIVLGSSSPRRIDIIRTIDPDALIIPADIDERAIRHPSPHVLTARIARAKSEALRNRVPDDAILVTADSVVWCQGCMREKPCNAREARAFLITYRNTTPATCIVGMMVYNMVTGVVACATDEATIRFKNLDDTRIDQIVADGSVLSSAGAFLIEHPLFAGTIASIEGDRETILGMPGRVIRSLIDAVAE